ncbi:4'-phosphopantetheinyl transferase family protein [Aliivibrio fischeri]|uniref:4'-phosphopantetheinyl transferase family protein n=1 Tax=Aliivibrio fischeri TaxID=668 RepID=UPI001F2DFF7D|nr:4'-phosphopantetheinyl transferase superfamily protein [Aliivibrio fischeri]MCE7534917.1 4'-phosphopantetheinyl transferase superfamily protein [Aliivibrio fischeri]MCE7559359.1 4'-phosphopantetheinyl transferase superfamily protein [Aliivibrio fischeri]
MGFEIKEKLVTLDYISVTSSGLNCLKQIPTNFPFIDSNIYTIQIEFPFNFISEEDFENFGIKFPSNFHKVGENRRKEYLVGRLCARKALELAGKINPQSPNSNIDGSPKWPDGFVGSISHTEHIAAASVTRLYHYSNLGIDIEPIMNKNTCNIICNEILVPEEDYFLRPKILESFQKEQYTTLIFSAKESIYKSLYKDVGNFFGFDSLCLEKAEGGILTFSLRNSLSNKWCKGVLIDVHYKIFKDQIYTFTVSK